MTRVENSNFSSLRFDSYPDRFTVLISGRFGSQTIQFDTVEEFDSVIKAAQEERENFLRMKNGTFQPSPKLSGKDNDDNLPATPKPGEG